ncbi:MAG: AIR synthase-related protein, partial [Bdellovibrionales bacterium]
LYKGSEFDCAGFAAGFVEDGEIWGSHRVQVGSEVWALPSSGFHSNGYSLLRKVFEKDLDQWMDELLIPTALYVQEIQSLKKAGVKIQACAHITGSGFENLLRVLPAYSALEITEYEWPHGFKEVQRRCDLSDMEMLKTLNCGIGFSIFIEPGQSPLLQQELKKVGCQPQLLGHVRAAQDSQEPYFVWKGQKS